MHFTCHENYYFIPDVRYDKGFYNEEAKKYANSNVIASSAMSAQVHVLCI